MTDYRTFFRAATGVGNPYAYQSRLACGEGADLGRDETLRGGRSCDSLLVNIPTGLGKTAAVVLAWLWNRVILKRQDWPRRLVYCLPMRTLVEQTKEEVEKWLKNLLAKASDLSLSKDAKQELQWLVEHSPVVLMGGEELDAARRDWDIYPEKPCILIGTQDMLLSRALNRGYGMSRYRWPMHFGLLNNDCLWVLDETQLLGVGLETSAQLDALRRVLTPKDHRLPDATWWMSATLEARRLATVDHAEPTGGWPRLTLEKADLQLSAVRDRFRAKKPIQPAEAKLSADTKKEYAKTLAAFIAGKHESGSLTLVVVNNVGRAQDVYQQLKQSKTLSDPLALIHSRFRPADRAQHETLLRTDGGRIVIATQAVEAGVDVSARTLITELAPWSALVQRIGRCNRRGEFASESRVFWVDVQLKDDSDNLGLPYTAAELVSARKLLKPLDDAGPETLAKVVTEEPRIIRPILRRKDIVELFDTTPDLAGHDLDISRYIRDGVDTDVQVFWRDCGGEAPKPKEPEPNREELCRVSILRFQPFLDYLKKARGKHKEHEISFTAYVWNHLDEQWEQASHARAGGTYLLDVRIGGYSLDLGWTGELADPKQSATWTTPLARPDARRSSGFSGDESSFTRAWVTLRDHTRHLVEETAAVADAISPHLAGVFTTAARWHDVGKAHTAFQQMLARGGPPPRNNELWAKSANAGGRCARRFFRHELASALAWLQTAPADAAERDLVAYLVAAHHGKVRLSIRSLPDEEPPSDRPDARIARGVIEGDPLGPVDLDGVSLSVITLDLRLMELGRAADDQPSWLARMIALRDRFGPFLLAWLETLLRAADGRASAGEMRRDTKP